MTDAPTTEPPRKRSGLLRIVGPGLLVAATGVGAGDLATAAFTGMHLGVAVLWAVLLGAILKFVLNEGLARWQLATDRTLLEGCMEHLGRPFQAVFLVYLLVWSFAVGSALMSACGVAAHAIVPVFDDPATGKIVFGAVHSLAGVALVIAGGYRLFERVMAVCIGVMFCTVVASALLLRPDMPAVLQGLFVPRIPDFHGDGLGWTVALMGGVGGTLTVLCYGYWIREAGRSGPGALPTCRVDLATGYVMTALFGMAMVIIGSRIAVEGKGAGLVIALADALTEPLGPVGRWVFLIGAWGAVFSSLFGVWQSVPYIFADFLGMALGEDAVKRSERVSTGSRTYRAYLIALAVVPMPALFFSFAGVQKIYAILGACFMPFLAIALLYLNGFSRIVSLELRNRPLTNLTLIATLLFFAYIGYRQFAG